MADSLHGVEMDLVKRRVFVLFVAVTTLLSLVVVPAHARTTGCASRIGDRIPVVLVHGLSGRPSDWTTGKTSMSDSLKRVSGIYLDDDSAFDYSKQNQQWVDNENIGPKLARRIACLAAASRQAGGYGKVVVIGHSMGGLATRYAAAQVVGGRRVSQDIGLVVTIGTPNTGSGWANAWSGALRYVVCPVRLVFGEYVSGNNSCALNAVSGLRNSSDQIKRLPWLPDSIPVLAVAGDVTVTFPIFQTTLKETGSDLIVSKKSALKGAAHTESGGGRMVAHCTISVVRLRELAARTVLGVETFPPCYHSNLPHNKQVTAATVEAIRKYQASLSFGKYAGRWDVHGTVLRIKANRTGELAWNAGSCGEPIAGVNCNGIAQLRFVSTGNGIRGTITSIRYQPWTDDPLPPDFTPPTGGYQVGDALSLRLIAPGVLQRTAGPPGNPYYCAEQASEEWHSKCNA